MAITSENITYASSIDPSLTALKAVLTYDSTAADRPLLVVMHGFSESSTAISTATKSRMPRAVYLYLSTTTGTFSSGETISSGGVSALLFGVKSGLLACGPAVGGDFTEGTTVTGGTSGATATIASIVDCNIVCLFVDMRGRNSSSGTQDAGGREVYDIKDAITWVLANRASRVDASQIHIVGYSGGGGNVLSCIARFPDLFNSAISYFGISDYGYVTNIGWWWHGATGSGLTNLQTWVGGTPLTHRSRYKARMTVEAVSNYAGTLHLFHDLGDSSVPVENSQRVYERMSTLETVDVTLTTTTTGDSPRISHGYPNLGAQVGLSLFEPGYMDEITHKIQPAWTVPTSGALIVPGYVSTTRLEFWCDDGLEHYATLIYNLTTRRFAIRGTTGAFSWTLKIFSQTPGASVTVTVDSVEYTDTVSGAGVAEYSGTYTPPISTTPQVVIPEDIWDV